MATINKKMQNDNKNVIGAVVAGVTGAAAIAGVAVAATIALKDEKTRGKVKKMLINAKDQVIDYVDTFKTELSAKKNASPIKKNTTRKVRVVA